MNFETLQCVAVMSNILISQIYIVANDLFQSLFDGCAKRRADLLIVPTWWYTSHVFKNQEVPRKCGGLGGRNDLIRIPCLTEMQVKPLKRTQYPIRRTPSDAQRTRVLI